MHWFKRVGFESQQYAWVRISVEQRFTHKNDSWLLSLTPITISKVQKKEKHDMNEYFSLIY